MSSPVKRKQKTYAVNQHTTRTHDTFTNAYGTTGPVASFTDLTLDELYQRGNVIIDSTKCHAWTRAKQRGWQYGVINLSLPDGTSKSHHVHRLVLHLAGVLEYGDKTLHGLHRCGKPWCVNLDHLYPGTNSDNVKDRYAHKTHITRYRTRPTWKDTWFKTAQLIALRSECVRRQAGCVIVGADRRVVGSGVNGKPDGLSVSGPCDGYCPRASTGGSLDYSDCVFVHDAMNALMYSDRTRREGGTAYTTTCPCLACAKALSNSGLAHVVCAVGIEDQDRQPERAIRLMMDSGLHVEIWYAPKVKI